MKKVPLLRRLVSLNPGITEKELYARILCGEVYVAGEKVKDPEQIIPVEAVIRFQHKKFVSRGGEKLDYALTQWHIDASGKTFIDAGSSTGGFCQVLLLYGACHVHAVDVGYNQLDYTLRTRLDVSVHERTNIMDIAALTPPPDAAVVDISFRSVVPVIRHIIPLLKERWLIALIKPQFEWKNPDENFDGIVRTSSVHRDILENVIRSLWKGRVFPVSILESPIPGRKGNREFLFKITEKADHPMEYMIEAAADIVRG